MQIVPPPTRGPEPRRRLYLYDDFVTSAIASALNWGSSLSGTGAAASAGASYGYDTTNKAMGIVQITTGTTTTGRAGLSARASGNPDNIIPTLGPCEFTMRVAVEALSTAGEEYAFYVGLIDNLNAAGDVTDGVYFVYDRVTNGDFWCASTATANTRTRTVGSVAPTTSYVWLRCVINAAWTSADFYVNDVLIATIATNLPVSGRATALGMKIEKSAGTTTRNADIDVAELIYDVVR